MTSNAHPYAVSVDAVREALRTYISSEVDLEHALSLLPATAFAVILYGSAARGEMTNNSDIDIIVVAENYRSTRSRGIVNVSTYNEDKLLAADATIFGSHLRQDAIFVHGRHGSIASAVSHFNDPDTVAALEKVRRIAQIIQSEPEQQRAYLKGLTRLARYLVRTALYLEALRDGDPCFSVRELAKRKDEPGLIQLLSSHQSDHPIDSVDVLHALLTRLQKIVGPVAANPYGSIPTLVVAEWEADPDLSTSALRTLGRSDSDPYIEIPRIMI